LCHGFTGNKLGTPYGLFVQAAREFCKNGFAVLRFDFRGSGDSEGDFEGQTIATEIEDLDAALNFLGSVKNINHNKVGLVGHSRGGVIGILKTADDKKVRCLVTWASVGIHMEIWTRDEIKEVEKKGYVYREGFRITKKLWKEDQNYDIIDAMKKIKVPFQIIHGNKDETVPYSHAMKLFKNANEPKELVTVYGADHTFTNEMHRKKLILFSLKWLKKWLK
jgi:dipeptidyl aminopeptidase/acylaminoacyl peptidase